jgi:hypothetical protein
MLQIFYLIDLISQLLFLFFLFFLLRAAVHDQVA